MSLNFPSISSCHSTSSVSDIDLPPSFTCLKETSKVIVVVGSVPHVCHMHFVVNQLVIVLVWYNFMGIVMALEKSVNLSLVIL